MSISLPTSKTQPKPNLEDYIVFLYGSPKIGKTTFCSQFDNPLFLSTEAGTNALSVFQIPIACWEDFLEACNLIFNGIKKGKPSEFAYKTIIIDTIDNLIKFCSDYVLKKNGVSHESDLPFGKGYVLVKEEFRKVLTKLSLLPVGLVMISHEKVEEVKTRTSVLNKSYPTIPKSYRELVLGMSDLILFAHSIQRINEQDGKVEEVRVLRTKGSENWEAGDRTGKLPETLKFTYNDFINNWYNNKTIKKGDNK